MLQAYGCGEVGSMSEIRKAVRGSFPQRTFEPFDVDEWRGRHYEFLRVCKEAEK
jgi:hypothetical protein